jgi:hypothetical protein
MKKDNVLGIVIMGCGLLLVLSVFLPYISYFSTSMSLWNTEDASRIMYILLGIFVIVLYLINKKTDMAYLTAGYGVFTSLSQIISLEGLEGLSVGFYLILMSSIAIGVITFLYDEKEADSLINLSAGVNKTSVNTQNTININSANNVGIDTPIVNQQIQNMGLNQVEQPKPVRFDPMTGDPIYLNENNN